MIDYLPMNTDTGDPEQTLEDWRAGRLSRDDLYDHAYSAMFQGAKRGFAAMMAYQPHEHDVVEVVVTAFLELEQKDPNEVGSISGLARSIANMRARDFVRRRIRQSDRDRSIEEDRAFQLNAAFAELDALDEERRGRLGDLAFDCLRALPPKQREVVEATVLHDETLSDWARREQKTHQAASRQQGRALDSLRRCLDQKTADLDRGEEDQSNE